MIVQKISSNKFEHYDNTFKDFNDFSFNDFAFNDFNYSNNNVTLHVFFYLLL
jgi:hypothetical protein